MARAGRGRRWGQAQAGTVAWAPPGRWVPSHEREVEKWGGSCLHLVLPGCKDSLGHLHAGVGASGGTGSSPQSQEGSAGCAGFLRTWGRSAEWGAASLHPGPTLPARFGDAALLPDAHRRGSTPCADAARGSRLRAPPCTAPLPRTFVSDQVVSQHDEKTEQEEDNDGHHPADHRVVGAGGRGHWAGVCPDGKGRENREKETLRALLRDRGCCSSHAPERCRQAPRGAQSCSAQCLQLGPTADESCQGGSKKRAGSRGSKEGEAMAISAGSCAEGTEKPRRLRWGSCPGEKAAEKSCDGQSHPRARLPATCPGEQHQQHALCSLRCLWAQPRPHCPILYRGVFCLKRGG